MLLPYVWLRLMGMGVVGAYDGYQALILIVTVLAAYASFLKIRRKPLAAFVFSMVYTTAVYRALDAFVRGPWVKIWPSFSCRSSPRACMSFTSNEPIIGFYWRLV